MEKAAGKQRKAISLSVGRQSATATTINQQKRSIGLTKDNRCWVCKEPLDQPKKGRLRLTCSDACRKARSRFLQGKNNRKLNRQKKLVERRRAKPFIERKFNKTFFEPVLEVNSWLKWYECLACGKPYEVNRMKNGNPPRPYCSIACENKSKYHWNKFLDAYERAHQRGEDNPRVRERLDYDKLSPLCPRCGIPFAPNTTLHGKRKPGRPRKYCSDKCRKEAYEQRWKNQHKRARVHRYANCLECGEKFDRTDSIGRRRLRFCSKTCTGNFCQRALRARKSMGIKIVKAGRIGQRIAARGAARRQLASGIWLTATAQMQNSRKAQRRTQPQLHQQMI